MTDVPWVLMTGTPCAMKAADPNARADERAEELPSAFLRKHRRNLIVVGIILAILIVGGMLLSFLD